MVHSSRINQNLHFASCILIRINDKGSFHKYFNKLIDPPRVTLPRSLRVNGQDVRRPSKIKKAWADRFKLANEEEISPENETFQASIAAQNEERVRSDEHRGAHYNRPYDTDSVKRALGKADDGKDKDTQHL